MSEIAVVKFGSNLVKNDDGLNTEAIFGYAQGLVESYTEQGRGLIVVTSGAVAAGRHRAEEGFFSSAEIESMTLEQFSSLGATAIFNTWEEAFEEQGVMAASVPVTHRQLGGGPIWERLSNHREKKTFLKTLLDNMEHGIPMIINEADAISVTELMKLKCGGDNDGLGSHLATAVKADLFTIFTKKGGLYDDDGQLIEVVGRHNLREVRQMVARRDVSNEGRGGFPTKLEACWRAAKVGVASQIAAVNQDMTGQKVTRFVVE